MLLKTEQQLGVKLFYKKLLFKKRSHLIRSYSNSAKTSTLKVGQSAEIPESCTQINCVLKDIKTNLIFWLKAPEGQRNRNIWYGHETSIMEGKLCSDSQQWTLWFWSNTEGWQHVALLGNGSIAAASPQLPQRRLRVVLRPTCSANRGKMSDPCSTN